MCFNENIKEEVNKIGNDNEVMENQYFYGIPFFGIKKVTRRFCNCQKLKRNVELCEVVKNNPLYHLVELDVSKTMLNTDYFEKLKKLDLTKTTKTRTT